MYVKVISATGILFKGEVTLLKAPAVHGLVSFYGSPSPCVMALQEGEVFLKPEPKDGETFEDKTFFIKEGYLHITYDKAQIIVNS
ncbi:MAG TPA: hypothetical protein VI959_03705 [Alphaproteobacteria bacterium]|nr:hypothetical protein [Alphaproteobacteria bacterium]